LWQIDNSSSNGINFEWKMFAFGSPAKVTPANLAAAMKHLLAMGHPAKF